MQKEYKKFDDLEFIARPEMSAIGRKASQAVMCFKNDYGISVLLGSAYYSNGTDKYEVCVLYEGEPTCNSSVADNILSNVSAEDITEIMRKIQDL